MALIWADGFTGDKALALLWQRYQSALAHTKDKSLSSQERGQALEEVEDAKASYDKTVAEAEMALKHAAIDGQPQTHALIIGVGYYSYNRIKALTTSVYGAQKFLEWILTRFLHPDRPLGSVELLLSNSNEQENWHLPSIALEKLGLDGHPEYTTLSGEAATFANIKDAFERWLKRACANMKNAAFFYFSGHGLWKSKPFLLPEDANIADSYSAFENLIDIEQTQRNMFNTPPSIQCFFIDACQDFSSQLLENLDPSPGRPLRGAVNAPAIPDRDAWLYLGSYIDGKAYGPASNAPFFTQELLDCLEKSGADGVKIGKTWRVTTSSLRTALEAASSWRKEKEAKDIRFSVQPGQSTFTADLCHIQNLSEVFVKVWCRPPRFMSQGELYIESGGVKSLRALPRPDEWYTKVTQTDCLAGVEFHKDSYLTGTTENFEARPPLHPVQLEVESPVIKATEILSERERGNNS